MVVYDKGDITRKFRVYTFQLIESSRLAFVNMTTNLPGQQREAQFYSRELDLYTKLQVRTSFLSRYLNEDY